MDHRRCDVEPAELTAVKAGYNSRLLRVRVFVAANTNLVSEDGYAAAGLKSVKDRCSVLRVHVPKSSSPVYANSLRGLTYSPSTLAP